MLNWLVGSPCRFKTYIGNCVSSIVKLIATDRWNHVNGLVNLADCASRGLFPSELLNFALWWDGPKWLRLGQDEWPKQFALSPNDPSQENGEVCLHAALVPHHQPVISLDRFSSFTRLVRVTAWLMHFTHNCHARNRNLTGTMGPLSVQELNQAKTYWISVSQRVHFDKKVKALETKTRISQSSFLRSFNPFFGKAQLLRVGGRESNLKLPHQIQHPVIIHGKHLLTKLLIRSEHIRLLHAGPTLLAASLCRQFYIVGCRKVIQSITRSCVTCQRKSS